MCVSMCLLLNVRREVVINKQIVSTSLYLLQLQKGVWVLNGSSL